MQPLTLTDELRREASRLGFVAAGVAQAGEVAEDHRRYVAYLEQGFHGEMAYLADNVDVRRRTDTRDVLEGARSVVVVAIAYGRNDEGLPLPGGFTIARYARGRDYHGFVRDRVRQLARWMRQRLGAEARPMIDTAPVLERAWAARAGVGFVGKNGCVIVPGVGSYVLLGVIATTAELPPDPPATPRCGECRSCLDACPTGAFVAPHVLDARRCVSYLTIELRSAIPEALREGVGARLFGCDVCQEVCPFNRAGGGAVHLGFALDARWRTTSLEDVARLTEDGFAQLTRGTALSRAGRDGLVRNAVVVMGNTRARRYLPVLREVEASDGSAVVREAAAWATARCGG